MSDLHDWLRDHRFFKRRKAEAMTDPVCEHELVAAVFTFKAILLTEPLTGTEMLEKLRERLAYAGYTIERSAPKPASALGGRE